MFVAIDYADSSFFWFDDKDWWIYSGSEWAKFDVLSLAILTLLLRAVGAIDTLSSDIILSSNYKFAFFSYYFILSSNFISLFFISLAGDLYFFWFLSAYV